MYQHDRIHDESEVKSYSHILIKRITLGITCLNGSCPSDYADLASERFLYFWAHGLPSIPLLVLGCTRLSRLLFPFVSFLNGAACRQCIHLPSFQIPYILRLVGLNTVRMPIMTATV